MLVLLTDHYSYAWLLCCYWHRRGCAVIDKTGATGMLQHQKFKETVRNRQHLQIQELMCIGWDCSLGYVLELSVDGAVSKLRVCFFEIDYSGLPRQIRRKSPQGWRKALACWTHQIYNFLLTIELLDKI
jgi:hypothetical protein